MNRLTLAFAVLSLALASSPILAQPRAAPNPLALEIFRELVEINTVTATGDTARAADAMAARLLAEQDGHFYGRGTGDDKFMAAAFVANLVRYKKEGYKPDRDLILVLETDEETGDAARYGIGWLIKNHRALIDAEFALNEGAGIALDKGKPLRVGVQTSEKVYMDFKVEARDVGGHSSQPGPGNAIYRLAAALSRIGDFHFPMALNETTRAWFERASKFEEPAIASDMRAIAAVSPDPEAVKRLSAIPRFNAQMPGPARR